MLYTCNLMKNQELLDTTYYFIEKNKVKNAKKLIKLYSCYMFENKTQSKLYVNIFSNI